MRGIDRAHRHRCDFRLSNGFRYTEFAETSPLLLLIDDSGCLFPEKFEGARRDYAPETSYTLALYDRRNAGIRVGPFAISGWLDITLHSAARFFFGVSDGLMPRREAVKH